MKHNKDKYLVMAIITGGILTFTLVSVKIGFTMISKNKDLNTTITEMKSELDDVNKRYDEVTNLLNDSRQSIDMKNKEINELKNKINEYEREVSLNPDDVMSPSGATEYHLRKALKGTDLEKFSSAFVKAEDDYGVNAFIMASIVAQESQWGMSDRAKRQNNMTGYAVYSNSSEGKTFGSKTENILATAKLLKDNYLEKGARYYNGRDIESVNLSYCKLPSNEPDMKWSTSIRSIGYDLVKRANSEAPGVKEVF